MAVQSKTSYKAKWLASLSDKQETPIAQAASLIKGSDEIKNAQVNTVLQIQKVHGTLIQAAMCAKSLISVMDESSSTPGLDFGQVGHEIDSKITKLDSNLIARRLRDVIKLAEARIGVLSAIAENALEANTLMANELLVLRTSTNSLERAAVESFYIGSQPTRKELDDLGEDPSTAHKRFGVVYDDLPDEWLDSALPHASNGYRTRRETLETLVNGDDEDDESGSESETDSHAVVLRQNGKRQGDRSYIAM